MKLADVTPGQPWYVWVEWVHLGGYAPSQTVEHGGKFDSVQDALQRVIQFNNDAPEGHFEGDPNTTVQQLLKQPNFGADFVGKDPSDPDYGNYCYFDIAEATVIMSQNPPPDSGYHPNPANQSPNTEILQKGMKKLKRDRIGIKLVR